MEGPTSKKTNEPPKRVTTRGTSSFSNPSRHEKHINNEKGGPFARTPSLDEPSPIAIACFKREVACTRCNITGTL